MSLTLRLGAVAVVLAAGLSGCGKMGALERPGPLFGPGRATSTQANDAERQGQDPTRPVSTVDPRDNTTDPSPPRTVPIPGSGQNPFGQAPQGVIPDPYARPR